MESVRRHRLAFIAFIVATATLSMHASAAAQGLYDLMPGGGDRFGRALSLSFELSDTNDLVVLPIEAVLDPSRLLPEETGRKVIVDNPDSRLWKGSITVKPGAWLHSVDDFSVAYERLADYRKAFPDEMTAHAESLPAALGKSVRWPVRLLNGLSFTYSTSERPQVQDGDLVERFLNDDAHAETVEFSLELARLAGPTVKERKSLYSSFLAHVKAFGPAGIPKLPACNGNARQCLQWLSGTDGKHWLGLFLPKLEYKTIDQFDFYKFGGAYSLVGVAEQDKYLWTFKASWDLKAFFDVGSQRAEAVSVLKLAKDIESALAPPSVADITDVGTFRAGDLVFLNLTNQSGAEVSWAITQDGCDRRLRLSKTGVLAGIMREECIVTVQATETSGLKRPSAPKAITLRLAQ